MGKESKSCLSLKLIKQIKRATCKPDDRGFLVLCLLEIFFLGGEFTKWNEKTNINSEEQAERTHIQTDRHGGHSFNCSDRNEHIVKKSLVCLLRTLSSTLFQNSINRNRWNWLNIFIIVYWWHFDFFQSTPQIQASRCWRLCRRKNVINSPILHWWIHVQLQDYDRCRFLLEAHGLGQ